METNTSYEIHKLDFITEIRSQLPTTDIKRTRKILVLNGKNFLYNILVRF